MSVSDDRADLVEIERRRLQALVDADVPAARELHADDFQLVTPGGATYTKDEYLADIASGAIDYRIWEPHDINARVCGDAGCLRYHSRLEIVVAGRTIDLSRYWHTDYYERRDGRWQVIWSHATEVITQSTPLQRHSRTLAHGDVPSHPAPASTVDNQCVTAETGGLYLHLESVLRAPRERVFAACVEPEQLAAWWGPEGFTASSVDLDVRTGGRYRITMQPPDGEAFNLGGRYSQVDPPRRLVFTFEWEQPDPDDQETVVKLSFLDDHEGTKLVLDQGPFATDARYALHEAGWTETLERLVQFLA